MFIGIGKTERSQTNSHQGKNRDAAGYRVNWLARRDKNYENHREQMLTISSITWSE